MWSINKFGIAGALIWSMGSALATANEVTPRIIGGTDVPTNMYRFMVAMYKQTDINGDFIFTCGGSSIGPRWVLTAAHCVVDNDSGQTIAPAAIRLKTGVGNIDDEGTVVNVQTIYVHPDYNIETSEADVALLELTREQEGSRIALPSQSSSFPDIDGVATVVGWGATSEGGYATPVLQEVVLPLVPQPDCLPFYPNYLSTKAMICAGGNRTGGKDSCHGDSGGPIFVVRDGFYVQAGIVSFGDDIGSCARPTVPGVYTRVSHYVNWIYSIAPGLPAPIASTEESSSDQTLYVDVSSLAPYDSPQQGVISHGDVRVYEIAENASRVELRTIEGDADLYIVSGTTFDKSDIVCGSLQDTELDSCELESQTDRTFALVFGYEDSRYSIVSPSPRMPSGDDPETDVSASDDGGGSTGIFLTFSLVLIFTARRKYRRLTGATHQLFLACFHNSLFAGSP